MGRGTRTEGETDTETDMRQRGAKAELTLADARGKEGKGRVEGGWSQARKTHHVVV